MNIKALLKQLPISAYLVVAGIASVVGTYQGWAYHMREVGKRDLLIATADSTNADLRHQADSLSKVYRTDTLRLTKVRRVTDSLTVTVDRWKHDTLKVVEYVAKSDTTIRACTQALGTCEQRVSIAQRGWDGARSEIALIRKQMPSPAQKWLYLGAGLGVGVLAGRIGR